jgi:2,3-bisphosphoglycerate-independent phosphoglycerate mutase
MDQQHKHWIENASYIKMLKRWLTAPAGDPILQGETGEYYTKMMQEKRRTLKQIDQSDVFFIDTSTTDGSQNE